MHKVYLTQLEMGTKSTKGLHLKPTVRHHRRSALTPLHLGQLAHSLVFAHCWGSSPLIGCTERQRQAHHVPAWIGTLQENKDPGGAWKTGEWANWPRGWGWGDVKHRTYGVGNEQFAWSVSMGFMPISKHKALFQHLGKQQQSCTALYLVGSGY